MESDVVLESPAAAYFSSDPLDPRVRPRALAGDAFPSRSVVAIDGDAISNGNSDQLEKP